MSDPSEPGDAPRAIARIFRGQPATDGAGVRMTRVIGTPALDHIDPFLLLDEFRSDDPDDYIAGFPDHPHRGFETVTYMLAGAMEHGDNQGNRGLLGPGSVQWMTAGRGIVHSELPRQEQGLMWGFQLWVNLPAAQKMRAPRYQDIPASAVPEVSLGDGVVARIIAGELAGVEGPVAEVPTEPFYLDVHMEGDSVADIPTPRGHNAFVYVYEGEVNVRGSDGDRRVARSELGLLGDGDYLDVANDIEARFLLIGARPLGEPVARYGPFVMNTQEELRQAFEDFRAGRF